jgi:hypothetical protein
MLLRAEQVGALVVSHYALRRYVLAQLVPISIKLANGGFAPVAHFWPGMTGIAYPWPRLVRQLHPGPI